VIYVPPVERRTERGIGQFFQTFSVYGAFKGIFGSLFGLKGLP
jgi:hypothetical protein